MRMFRLKQAVSNFFFRLSMKKKPIITGISAIAIIAVVAFFAVPIISYFTPYHWRNRLSRADILYDFDYMIATLEDNFPSFGIIYRRNGVDMLEVAGDVRHRLESERRIGFEGFWNILRDDFFYHASAEGCPLEVGHLRLVRYEEWLGSVLSYRGWNQPGRTPYRFDVLRNRPSDPRYRYLEARTTVLEREAGWVQHRVSSVNIIEEGQIGYIRLYTFLREPSIEEWNRLLYFYNEIADFEHLIIDIRGNTGGQPLFFYHMVTSFLIDRPLTTRFHHFMLGGEHNMRLLTAVGAQHRRAWSANDEGFNLGGQQRLFIDADVSSYIMQDIAKMDYRFIEHVQIRPWHENYRSRFSGQIWMLIDESNYSAALKVAAVHKQAGFATFVGETTSGGAAGQWSSNFIALPNSGIIIRYDPTLVLDIHGRPLEYGIEPHHFNRPGMDALETVLALIAEGEY